MRCAPLAILYATDWDTLVDVSQRSSQITHADPRARGCDVLNLTIAGVLDDVDTPLADALDYAAGDCFTHYKRRFTTRLPRQRWTIPRRSDSGPTRHSVVHDWDFSVHYVEEHEDGGRWECRWDRHPNTHNTGAFP